MAKLNRRNRQALREALANLKAQKQMEEISKSIAQSAASKANTPQSTKDAYLPSHPNPINKASMKTNEKTKCKPNETPGWKIFLEFGAAIIGGFVAVVYIFQLKAMIESNNINRQSLVIVQKAFFHLDGISTISVMGADKNLSGIMFYPEWENSGNTQALHVLRFDNSDWRPGELPADFNFPDKPSSQPFHVKTPAGILPGFVGPHSRLKSGPLFIPLEELRAVNQGTAHVYFWGHASYQDAFKCSHVTEYCSEIGSFDSGVAPTSNSAITIFECPKHNCVDEDCPDYTPSPEEICKP